MQRIQMNIRRINFFSFGYICNTTHPFYSFPRLYRLSSRNHFHPRAQRALRALHLLKQRPTPISNRGRHMRSAGHSYRSSPTPTSNRGSGTRTAQAILIEVAPPRPQTEAAACAQRRLLYKQCPTPTSNRGCCTCTAQAIIIVVAPPRSQTEAATRAQRRPFL